ncbi:hypothetical protein [Lewinella cohaerens]|uniref:hypothetical protein n=1 Tax=Lewinella cohaerens TaxID=70995 RepID=UPI00035DA0B2|nr:hypothetical protein [Lewinella cohaerens]
MAKQAKITEIAFQRTGNVFLNSGIAGVYEYLTVCQDREDFPSYTFGWSEDGNSLWLKSEQLFDLLEQLYYFMGQELYDTSGKNAREKADKYYFTKDPFSATPFFKMKSYGLAALVTNDPQPSPKYKENAVKFANLVEEDSDFATAIAKFYAEKGFKIKDYELGEDGFTFQKGEKGDAKIFLNEPYIKITRLDPIVSAYFLPGKEKCYLTGEAYQKLVSNQNTSPFLKGLSNFDSQLSPTTQKMSWKAMYLSRFAPKFAFYNYVSGLDSIVGFLLDSDTLKNQYQLYRQHHSFYLDQEALIHRSYLQNFKVWSFFQAKKGAEQQPLELPKDYVRQQEIQFMLIYSIYQQILLDQELESVSGWDDFLGIEFDRQVITLASFKADKFAGTMRPSSFEYFNNFKFVVRTIAYLEANGLQFDQLMPSLKFMKTSERNANNSYLMERSIRNKVLGKLMQAKSILPTICQLFYQCYTYLIGNENIGYKNFNQLKRLVELYEPLIPSNMNKEIQEKAFKLGTSIGRAIITYDNANDPQSQKSNAKTGRKYIIDLQKSRTLQQFNDAIVRMQNKYALVVSADLFKAEINEENFNLVKQFALIAALNQLNIVLKPFKNNNNE